MLAALFGWLLAFPMFGPLLFATAGQAAPSAGLVFVFAHGAGLLLLHFLPARGAVRLWLVRGAGVLAAALTLAFLFGPVAAPPVAYVLLAIMGPLAALLVLAWVDGWMGCGNRLAALAVAMAGANVTVAIVNLPMGVPPGLWLALTAALVLGCSFGLATTPPEDGEAKPEPVSPLLRGAIITVAAFALADYFVGGIWYNSLAASIAPVVSWQPCLEALVYAGAILLLFGVVRRGSGGRLALYSLSALGMGLVVAASGVAGAGAVFAFRAILLVGLAAGDLFFWDQLGQLGTVFGGRRTLGIGLGASLLLIGLANAGALLAAPQEGGPGRAFLLVGAALLFLVIPVIFRYTVGMEAAALATSLGSSASPQTTAAPEPHMLPEGLADFTPAERHVYMLLVAGATDQEIAAKLVISRHTVKFHVRNVLHKAGVANRKQLLSRLVAEGASATEEHERR